jgi:hypothetical protein
MNSGSGILRERSPGFCSTDAGVAANQHMSPSGQYASQNHSCTPRQMTTEHTILLLDIASRVAKKLRTDPRIANFLDPAVCIAAYDDGCDATLIERLKVMQITSEIGTTQAVPMQATSVGPSVAVLIADKSGATLFMLPDPRFYPGLWPWTTSEIGEH